MIEHSIHQRLLLDELSTVEVRTRIADGWEKVIVPLGATEQHGPALPLLVDSEHGLRTALRAARILDTGAKPRVTAADGLATLDVLLRLYEDCREREKVLTP